MLPFVVRRSSTSDHLEVLDVHGEGVHIEFGVEGSGVALVHEDPDPSVRQRVAGAEHLRQVERRSGARLRRWLLVLAADLSLEL